MTPTFIQRQLCYTHNTLVNNASLPNPLPVHSLPPSGRCTEILI